MKGNHFVGHLPQNIYWGENSQDIYFSWNPEDELLNSLYQTTINGDVPQKVSLDARKALPSTRGGAYNKASGLNHKFVTIRIMQSSSFVKPFKFPF